MDSQLPASSPMDTDFSVPPSPMDSLFSASASSSSTSSPMDTDFSFDCSPSGAGSCNSSTAPPLSPTSTSISIPSPTSACFMAATQSPQLQSCGTPLPPAPAQLARPSASFGAHRAAKISTTETQSQPQPQAQQQQQQQQQPRRRDLAFAQKLAQMALPLAPLVQLTTGQVHPAFPGTLLGFWLLTEAELEALAHFYHQRTPGRWTAHYPCPVAWDSGAAVEEKRRRLGRFIGLRGCETPAALRDEDELGAEARRARERDVEDEVWRRKLPWY
ncbi:hypothetical protein JX266_012203 [Neoarthrinium moseri]|nr:hypothetical protein JX266_012203 [Neoarthrinium moseri]